MCSCNIISIHDLFVDSYLLTTPIEYDRCLPVERSSNTLVPRKLLVKSSTSLERLGCANPGRTTVDDTTRVNDGGGSLDDDSGRMNTSANGSINFKALAGNGQKRTEVRFRKPCLHSTEAKWPQVPKFGGVDHRKKSWSSEVIATELLMMVAPATMNNQPRWRRHRVESYLVLHYQVPFNPLCLAT